MVGIDLNDYRRHPALYLLQLDIEFVDIQFKSYVASDGIQLYVGPGVRVR